MTKINIEEAEQAILVWNKADDREELLDTGNAMADILQTYIKASPEKRTETIELDLTHDEIYDLMLIAHEQDITLNDLIVQLLTRVMNDSNTLLPVKEDATPF